MWSKRFEKCIQCGTIDAPYHAYGLCRDCYVKKTLYNNPEIYKEMDKQYRQSPEIKKWKQEYYSQPEVRERTNKSAAKFRASNKELVLQRTREWRLENPDKLRDYELNIHRKMNKLRRYGPDAVRLIEEVGFICQKCGSDYRIAIHHIDWDPENNNYDNFAVLCGSCHSKIHWWIPKRIRRELFKEWMILPLEETDKEFRVRNIRFPNKLSSPSS